MDSDFELTYRVYPAATDPWFKEGATEGWLVQHDGVGTGRAVRVVALTGEDGDTIFEHDGDWQDVTIRDRANPATLTEFLLARIAEDEAGAMAAVDGFTNGDFWRDGDTSGLASAHHVATHGPARVLAECEAKRRIVARHRLRAAGGSRVCLGCGEEWPCPDLTDLASVYAADTQ